MKIAIVGTGGVGGYFGGKLAQYYANKKDVQITFIARGKHLKAIQNSGLKVMAKEGLLLPYLIKPLIILLHSVDLM